MCLTLHLRRAVCPTTAVTFLGEMSSKYGRSCGKRCGLGGCGGRGGGLTPLGPDSPENKKKNNT